MDQRRADAGTGFQQSRHTVLCRGQTCGVRLIRIVQVQRIRGGSVDNQILAGDPFFDLTRNLIVAMDSCYIQVCKVCPDTFSSGRNRRLNAPVQQHPCQCRPQMTTTQDQGPLDCWSPGQEASTNCSATTVNGKGIGVVMWPRTSANLDFASPAFGLSCNMVASTVAAFSAK